MGDAVDASDAMRRRSQPRPGDRAVAELAAHQHGVVSRGRLIALGFHPRAIDRRIAAGRLHPVHRGVYAVGHRLLAPEGRWMAAVLAGGADAVLSHRSAAALWGMRAYGGRAEITVPVKGRRPAGVAARYSLLQRDEVSTCKGIPTTTVARTLIDLAAVLDVHRVERVIREADYLGLLDAYAVVLLLERYPRRPGTAALRKAIQAAAAAEGRTRSELEDRFIRLLSKANLPRPELNAAIELDQTTIEADAVWRDRMLIVELDGRAAHRTRYAFERDRERDREAALRGWLVIRITWRQLHDDPGRVTSDLRRLLAVRTDPVELDDAMRRRSQPRAPDPPVQPAWTTGPTAPPPSTRYAPVDLTSSE